MKNSINNFNCFDLFFYSLYSIITHEEIYIISKNGYDYVSKYVTLFFIIFLHYWSLLVIFNIKFACII